jgi:AraC-like DNA-binding protein
MQPVMQMLRYRPAAPLSAFIDQFWYARGCDPDRKRQSALPTGSVDLTFNLAADDLRVFESAADHVGMIFDGAVVHGAQSGYFVLDARRDVHVVGVHFHPGGGAALLGVNAQELTDRHVALSDIWGERAHTLRAQLLDASTPAAKFALLEQVMLKQLGLQHLRARPLVHPAISFALRGMQTAPTEVRIAELQVATGYSSRRFTTLFSDAVGLTPKLYSRINRLRSVVERVAHGGEVAWADLASEYGYYGQSHLTRDFREFSGVTPGEYRPVAPGSALHMEIDGERGR